MKTNLKIYQLCLVSILIFFSSCGGSYTNGTIGNSYEFHCSSINAKCSECHNYWIIEFLEEENALLYSNWESNSTNPYRKYCNSLVYYKFNSKTGSIHIDRVYNPQNSLSELCISGFIGEWKWNSTGKHGKGFYLNDDCYFAKKDL